MSQTLAVSVSSTQTMTRAEITVSAASTSTTGNALGVTTASELVEIINDRSAQWPIEYRVGSGAWQSVGENKTATVVIDLSTTTLAFRRSSNAPTLVVDLRIYSKPEGFSAGQQGDVAIFTAAEQTGLKALVAKYEIQQMLLPGQTLDRTGTSDVRAILAQAVSVASADFALSSVPIQIVLPEGRYRIDTSGVTWATGIGLRGVDKYGTFLIPSGDFAPILRTANGSDYLTDCIFQDFTIDCIAHSIASFNSQLKGFYIKRMRKARFLRLRVLNAAATAFGNDFLEDCVYEECEAINSGRAATDRFGAGAGFGLACGLSALESLVLNNCRSEGHGTSGFYAEFSPSSGATFQPRGMILNGFVAKGGYVGICDAGAQSLQVNGGTLEGNQYYGFLSTQNGASTQAGLRGKLRGVLIAGNGSGYGRFGAGVGFASSASGVAYDMDNNTIVKNGGYGVLALAPVDLALVANTIADNGGAGVALIQPADTTTGAKLRAGHNRVRRNGQGVLNDYTGDGITIAMPVDYLRIKDNDIGDSQGSPTQTTAVALRGGYTSLVPIIADNDLRTSGAAPVRTEHTVADSSRVAGNITDGGSAGTAVITNLVTNPRFELTTTGVTNIGATASRPSGASPISGTYVYRLTATAAALMRSTMGAITVTSGSVYTFAVHVRCNSGLTVGISMFDGADGSTVIATGPRRIADGNWQRLTMTVRIPSGVASIRPYWYRLQLGAAAAGDIMDADGVSLTAGQNLYAYFDGSSAGGAWTGTADASTSTKTL